VRDLVFAFVREPETRFARQICDEETCVRSTAQKKPPTRTFAAAMLFICALRPVSRLVLVSGDGGGRERREGQRPDVKFADLQKAPRDRRGGKQTGTPCLIVGARTHHHDGTLHALHSDRFLATRSTTTFPSEKACATPRG